MKRTLSEQEIMRLSEASRDRRVGNVQSLIDTFGDWAGGTFTGCMDALEGKPGINNPEALCAWLHKQALGVWPAEDSLKAPGLESRAFEFTEVRAVKDKLRLEGHAAVFNRLSEDLGGFREQIMPGAFAQSIAEDDIMALFNHDSNYVLGRNRAGTLQLGEDTTGLHMVISLPDTQVGRDLLVSVERRDITGASFSFFVPQGGDRWEHMEGIDLRTLLFARLKDVSPVAFPAYRDTDVAIARRSHESWKTAQQALTKPVARLLRERKLRLLSRD